MAYTDTTSSSTPILGLNTYSDPTIIKPEELTYALNAKSDNPFYSNYEGNTLYNNFRQTNPGYQIIGNLSLTNDDIAIWSVNNTTTDSSGRYTSEIGILDKNGIYTTKVNDYILNFSLQDQVQAKYKTNVFGERVVYWCDNHRNPMRSINLDNIPTLDDGVTIDLSGINVYRNYLIPYIDFTAITSSGALLTGVYQFSTQYADANSNAITSFIPSTNPIPVYRDSETEIYDHLNGDPAGTTTGKSIELSITNLDPSFDFYNLVVIKTINGIQTAQLVATLPTSQTRFVYTGTSTPLRDIDLKEITLKSVTYKSASTVTESNGYLLWGNLRGNEDYNLQPYISNLRVEWIAVPIDSYTVSESYKNPEYTFSMKGYMRDEVYPLGFEFDLVNGTTTSTYHIPGRAKNRNSQGDLINKTQDQYGKTTTPGLWDVAINDSESNEDKLNISENERWEIYNTAYVKGTNGDGSIYGEMSYIESDTFTYPSNTLIWGSLANQPIRHHKFPDLSVMHIHDGKNDLSRNQDAKPILYIMGFRITNIQEVINSIPADIRAQIQGWRILKGDRTYDKSIAAKGIISNLRELDFNLGISNVPDVRVYQNYPFNDLHGDPHIRAGNNTVHINDIDYPTNPPQVGYRKDMVSFFSPDTMFTKPYLAVNEMKLESEEIGGAFGFYEYAPGLPRVPNVAVGDENNLAPVFIQQNNFGTVTAFRPIIKGNVRFKLNEALYVPFNTTVSGLAGLPIYNKFRESTVYLNTNNTKPVDDPQTIDDSRWFYGEGQVNYEKFVHLVTSQKRISMYMASIKTNISGQYGSIYSIKYLDTGYSSQTSGNNTPIFGGDIFLNFFSIKRTLSFFGDGLNQYIDLPEAHQPIDLRPHKVIPSMIYTYYRIDDSTKGYYGVGVDPAGVASDNMRVVPVVISGTNSFWVESEVNAELRAEGPGELDTYFPNYKSGSTPVAVFMGIKNSTKDNYLSYNGDYSIKNNLYQFDAISPNYDPNQTKLTDYYNKVIFSQKSQGEEFYDNWLIYKALDYYDFPKSKGQLVDMRYIGQSRILFRFEETLFLHALYGSLNTSEGEILLGSGKLFEKDPQEVSYSEVGSIGTRSQWAFNSNKAGQFMVDDIRAKIYRYSDKIEEISSNQMQRWFNTNLPLNLTKQFNIPADNPANYDGIGFISTYDHDNEMWILTKKDYSVINPSLITSNRLTYNNGHFYLDNIETLLSNTSVFENRSWTIGYSVVNQRWISFYSFLPNYYINSKLDYLSGNNIPTGTSIWKHLKGDHCTYYDTLYPYILETSFPTEGILSTKTSSISYISKAFVLENGENYEEKNLTFNQAIVYNDESCSGLLNLNIQDENNLSTLLITTSQVVNNITNIPLRKRDNRFQFSDFLDIVKQRNLEDSFFTKSPVNPEYILNYPIDKVIDNSALNYTKSWFEKKNFKGKYMKVRLILNTTGKYKLLTNFITSNQRISIR